MLRIAASALALSIAAGPVLAETHMGDMADLIRSRDITGGPVYTLNQEWDDAGWMGAEYGTVDTEWNQIGEIEDIVLNTSGELAGVVAEVGGFLDIGDKHVLLRVGDVKLVPVDDRSYSLVTRYSEEQLEEMEGVDEGWWN